MTRCLIDACERDAGHAWACHHCIDTMRRWLVELEDLAIIIALTLAPTQHGPRAGSIGSAFGSRPPADLAKVVFLDYRSGAGAAVHRLHDPRDADDDPIRSLPGSIHGIACWLREELGQTEPGRWTLASELLYLRGQISGCAHSQWITEVWEDLKDLYDTARRLAHDKDRPLGDCLMIDCTGRVFWALDGRTDRARCVQCGEEYTGLSLIRLGAAQEAG